MDKSAFFKLSYGLYIISSHCEGKYSACIANTFTQVTSDPQQVSITLNKENYTTGLIQKSKVLNCGVLLENVEMDIIRNFGFQSGRDTDKFATIDYQEDTLDNRQITKGIAATFTCKVKQEVDVGTHIIFICEVIDCKSVSEDEVLTYATYHSKKKGTTPKNAPSYIEETKAKGFRCTICGFILEEDVLPDDFICPICHQPASAFEKL